MKECRNDIVASGSDVWPRSCPRCGLGPCPNVANKEEHDKYTGKIPQMYEHETAEYLKIYGPVDLPPLPVASMTLTDRDGAVTPLYRVSSLEYYAQQAVIRDREIRNGGV